MSKQSRQQASAIIIAALAVLGFSPGAAAAGDLNEMCPVLTDEKADPAITTSYQGKQVAFCCDRCLAKFLDSPERYADRLPQFAATAGGHADEHETTEEGDGASKAPWVGRIHPVVVHYPLAGIPLALFGFLVWAATGKEAFAKADVVPLLVGTAASAAAYLTGNALEEATRFSEAMHEIAERHEFVSTTVMIICVCLTGLRLWRWRRMTDVWRWVYGGGLVLASALLAVTGYLGGSLVYGPDHLQF